MASFNKVLLMGNLTKTPELRYTQGGQAVCDMSIAINNKYTTNDGQSREDVCFVEVIVWAKQAESCNKYLDKGSPVFIEGRLKQDTWEDKQGKNRSKMRVVAEKVQFLSSKPKQENYKPEPPHPSQPQRPKQENLLPQTDWNNPVKYDEPF